MHIFMSRYDSFKAEWLFAKTPVNMILKSLGIQYVKLAQDVLENMIVCCPLLERLTLKSCDGVSKINIDAPNLQFLDVRGVYEDVLGRLRLARKAA